MKQRWQPKLLLILIVALAIVLRTIALERIPNGFIPEEVSTGWNAYSLYKTGRDEWGTWMPLMFRETGGFKLALNSYLTVPIMALIGPNEFAVRLSTALAGIIAVILTYILVKKLFHQEVYALAASFLLAISPWHVSIGRYSVDVNWGLPLFLAGLILLLNARHQPKQYLLAAFLFGLTFFTYFNYVVFTWLFLIAYLLSERKKVWVRGAKRRLVIFFIILIVMMSPYLVNANLFIRYNQATSISKIGLINQIHEHREACDQSFPHIVCRILYNKPLVFGLTILRNYIGHFSSSTLFINGAKLGLSGMPDGWGFFHLFEFPLLLYGIVAMVRKKLFTSTLAIWLFLYGIPSSLAAEGHMWRMFTLLPLPAIIGAIGLVEIFRSIHFSAVKWGIVGIISFSVLYFIADYFGYFPYAQGRYAYYGFRDAYIYASRIEENYDQIIVAPSGLGFDQLYIYYLFYIQLDPRAYQQGKGVERTVGSEGWVQVKQIGKWRFVTNVEEIVFSLPPKTLLVTDGTFSETNRLPGLGIWPTLRQTISYPNGDAAFKIIELRKNPDYKPEASLSATLK